jgi:uncharacterized protein YndB with AHSA1/START domain
VIVKSVVLRCDPQRAFSLFTEQAGLWWPIERRHTEDPASEIRLESFGRFFERAKDGTEVELGFVRTYEPASRLILDWYPGTGADDPTQVEITFEAVGPNTRVTIRHGPGAGGPERFAANAAAYGRSWNAVIDAMAHREL